MQLIKKGTFTLGAMSMLWLVSCSDEPTGFLPPVDNIGKACEVMDNGWTIPTQTVVDGGVGKDGIPSIDNPQFGSIGEAKNMQDDELVIVVKMGDIIRVYPQRILDQHEIVNDQFNGKPVAVTFCPQTGTALAFDRTIDGQVTTLGVSGLLYNSNLVMYDRMTDSKWNQMTTQSVNGEMSCEKLQFLAVIEMSWAGAKALFPEAQVLSGDTGFDRNYTSPPLSSQVPINSLPIFPYTPKDNRLDNYVRAHVIIDSIKVQAYTLDQFDDGWDLTIDNSNVLITHQEHNIITSYRTGGTTFQLTSDPDGIGVVIQDSDGNGYNLFGEIVSGERTGERLESTFSYMGYWFSLASMFPDPILFENGQD